jgi:hypothetical protein
MALDPVADPRLGRDVEDLLAPAVEEVGLVEEVQPREAMALERAARAAAGPGPVSQAPREEQVAGDRPADRAKGGCGS